MNPLIPVILSGGAGTRLWPLSRQSHPKPFLQLPDGETLLQKTLQRALALPEVTRFITVTNREYYFQTRDVYAQVAEVGEREAFYILEPVGRNTAPAIAAAALQAEAMVGPEATLLVLPADHLVQDQAAFAAAVVRAQRLAEAGYLVTFGITPAWPEPGYGYIEGGEALTKDGETLGFAVRRFVEKPDAATAAAFLAQGGYTWNSGMFCLRAEAFLSALASVQPQLDQDIRAAWAEGRCETDFRELAPAFAQVTDISVDYAVMEHADRVALVPGDFGWSDIGSWTSFGALLAEDGSGNQVLGESVLEDAQNCIVHSTDRLTALLGVEELIVVDTPDALLIARKDRDQDVKQIVAELKRRGHQAYKLHRTVHRPWGTYTVLEEGARFKIKRILVKRGAALSLQMHHHRSEHWIVVSGTAKIVNGDEDRLVHTNESTYIPAGIPHRLLNPGVIDLVMIEVQSGEYLGEDDIVRFDDRYGRVAS
ncbi:mannose-1-phosphate guanylyltransferase/mannose-6-phosphate isomerase [Acidithiobacillus sp.]|jgi:mannose-1-phosphate guanylyltransferase/mannose-6-phosphate isomerase|uniref:mannose-1-phosphate guanylyltransferase/mannose-6-phosphate isomerase n=1 Tax=Acidithiobacillus sp. TaxID=1872118 RepID=UPI0025C22FA1|nr:mannose-1-phosphate guanylyltransferase/mannose-6-phosphate isomerase [Acidithiobacillus sp.]MCK9187965.1 mannose-1-phosphate guanylyltransferase/mannose-6-phosphate isomerase [Acidithiobacillus sp.]MCK9359924.1 mannose-1-phosphate guanylyltransferase/mannose-6-phosphate isomerase [Acidithiobacillus sp.]